MEYAILTPRRRGAKNHLFLPTERPIARTRPIAKTLCGRLLDIGSRTPATPLSSYDNICLTCLRAAGNPQFVTDDTPRAPEHRYRIYALTEEGDLDRMWSTDSMEGVGVALCTLGAEGEFYRCAVGVLDSAGEDETYETGVWLMNPFDARVGT